MHNFGFALQGAWQVLLAGLILGAGLPTVFSFGVRALSWGAPAEQESAAAWRPQPLGMAVAGVCFVCVLAAVAIGISIIVAAGMGMEVSFEHGYPVFVPKD